MPGIVESRNKEGESESSQQKESKFKQVANKHGFLPDTVGQLVREYGLLITSFKSIPEADSRAFNVFILAQIDIREHLKVRRALHNAPTSVNFTDPLRLQDSV
jgi:hypothetical protein